MPAFASLLLASAVRASSLDLCADEYLLLLARPHEIGSVSRLAHDPADNVLWRSARRHRAHGRGLERVLVERPTLLVSTSGGGRGTQAVARAAGVNLLKLPYPSTIDEVEAGVVRVAKALGEPGRAYSWRRRLARLKAGRTAPRDAIFLGGGGTSVAATSLAAQWMALAGLRQRSLPGGRASLEVLATSPPEVVLRSTYRSGQFSLGQRWLDHPLARRSRSQVIATDGRPWTCAGPLMLAEVERLRGLR